MRRILDDDDEDTSEYNINLQIIAIFAVIISGCLGFALAYYFSKKLNNGTADKNLTFFILLFKGIGAGVIISTALVHLIGESYDGFTDSGLAHIYEPFPMVTALFGMYLMAVLEFFSHKGFNISSTRDVEQSICEEENHKTTDYDSVHALQDFNNIGHSHGHGHSHGEQELTALGAKTSDEIRHIRFTAIAAEVNIVVHSILIGIDLGLQNSARCKTLMVAICFHQFFEGFALSQMVSEATYNFKKTLIFAVFFTLTTPIGIGIGMGLHSSFDEESKGYLGAVAFLDAFCGGMLLFLGIVSFLLPWFIHNKYLLNSPRNSFAFAGFAGLFFGMAIMSVIGIWA